MSPQKKSSKFNRNMPKKPNRSQAIGVQDLSPTKLSSPVQPPEIEPTIRITKRVQIPVTLNDDAGSAVITVSALMAGVPGGTTYWQRFRVERVDIWGDQIIDSAGSASSTLRVTLPQIANWNQPNFQLMDSGTVGNERPRVAFRLGLLDRARWFGTADATTLCAILGAPSTVVIVQATVELISPPLSAA